MPNEAADPTGGVTLDLSVEQAAEGPVTDEIKITPALKTPDITPAQLVAGIPILAELLHTFGVYNLSQAQQDSLGKCVTWAFVLVGGDAVVRLGRNLRKHLS